MAKPMFVLPPKMQFFDPSTTQFLSGGKMFIYQPGTTTKINTYPTSADAIAGTNPNANPILLNTYGQPNVDLYISQAYKMVVARSTDTDPPTGTLIVSEDNLTTLGQQITVTTKTNNFSVAASDRDTFFLVDASGGPVAATLLTSASAGSGFDVKFKKIDTSGNAVTIQGTGSDTIDGSATLTLSTFNTFYETIADGVLSWRGTNTLTSYSPVRWEHMQSFATSGTFTVPSNVSLVFVEAWGGGGGAGATVAGATYGAGGGGGAFASGIVSVTPGASITVTIGAGGTGATLNTTGTGSAGGDTSFATSIVAKGGGGAAGGTSAAGTAGGAAASCTGTCALTGGSGGAGSTVATFVSGIGGSAAKMGVMSIPIAGGAGITNSGGGGMGGSNIINGGNGGSGYLVVSY